MQINYKFKSGKHNRYILQKIPLVSLPGSLKEYFVFVSSNGVLFVVPKVGCFFARFGNYVCLCTFR